MKNCQHCGLSEDEHHQWEPYEAPGGCVCDPRDWGNPRKIPPVCADLTQDLLDKSRCMCEHEVECHILEKK